MISAASEPLWTSSAVISFLTNIYERIPFRVHRNDENSLQRLVNRDLKFIMNSNSFFEEIMHLCICVCIG